MICCWANSHFYPFCQPQTKQNEMKKKNCFEVNASGRLPASKCKKCALSHEAVKTNGLFFVKFQLSLCFYNFLSVNFTFYGFV